MFFIETVKNDNFVLVNDTKNYLCTMKHNTIIHVIFAILTLLSSFEVYAQYPGGGRPGGGPGGERPQIEIKGKILDANTGNPLEFANVAIFSKRDSSVLAGGLTDAEGNFNIKSRPGKLYAIVEFMGYERFVIDPVPIDREKMMAGDRTVNLGEVRLGDSGVDLAEVEVRAEKSETQFSLDKRVFNVGKDLANRGGTAEDILDNVPSVTVDVEGQVSLRGSQGVRVLVDGKPSGMAASDNLRQIPANMIDKIEVITNPSARYEAEGMAGIINIILKKDDRSGFNGSFDVTGGFPAIAGVGANLNYRKGKINWFLNYGFNYRRGPGGGNLYQEIAQEDSLGQPLPLFVSEQVRDMCRGGFRNNIRAGIDYHLSEKEVLTGAFLYRISDEDNFTTLTYDDYLVSASPENLIHQSIRTDDEIEEESGLQYSLNYRKEFSNRNHFLNLTAQYEDELEKESSILDQDSLTSEGLRFDELNQRSANEEGQRRWQFQADFNRAFNRDHKYEIGFRSSLRNIANSYLVEEEASDGTWFNLSNLSNDFNYDEYIHAAYVQYGNKFNKFSFLAGLRGEYSIVNTELVQTNEVNDRDYFNLFPSLFLSYEITEGNSIQTSYSRRVRRPRFFDLNPFFTYSDNRNFFSGNPNLDPEFTDSYEINYLKIWDKATLSSGVFYRHSTGVIERIRQLLDDDTFITQPENLSTRDDVGLEFNIAYSGLKWLRFNTDLNFFRSVTEGTINEGLVNEQNFDAETLTWTARNTARFSFWNSDLQLRMNYRAPRQGAQSYYKSITSLDVGWSKDFLKSKNLSLTLSVRDVFNSRKRRYETIDDDFYNVGEFQWRARMGSVTASYRINQKKKRGRPGGGYQGGGDMDGGF